MRSGYAIVISDIPCQHDSETGIVAPGVLAALPFVDANAGKVNHIMYYCPASQE